MRDCFCVAAGAGFVVRAGIDSRSAGEAGTGCLADVQRRLFGPTAQPAQADQHFERRFPFTGVDLSRDGIWSGRIRIGDQIDAAGSERRVVFHDAGQRLGRRCAQRARDVALQISAERRRAHRAARRGDAGRYALFRNAGLQLDRAECERRQGEVAQDDRGREAGIFLHDVAAGRGQPRDYGR